MASRRSKDAVALSSVFCSGQFAGMMLAIGFAQTAAQTLPEQSWTLRQQSDDAVFRKLMPIVFLLNALTLGFAFGTSQKQSRLWFGVAEALVVATFVETMAINVPINVRVGGWTAGSAPATWTHERDRWLETHWVRTALGSLSFLCALAGEHYRADAG
jgi:hypothetical protein